MCDIKSIKVEGCEATVVVFIAAECKRNRGDEYERWVAAVCKDALRRQGWDVGEGKLVIRSGHPDYEDCAVMRAFVSASPQLRLLRDSAPIDSASFSIGSWIRFELER